MQFKLMQQVYIQSDVLNLGAPIGEAGYVVNIDRRIDQGQSYCVRVPSQQKWYWMAGCDLVSADEWLANEAANVIKESLVNEALDKWNVEQFQLAVGSSSNNS